jgi:hypothetical protein
MAVDLNHTLLNLLNALESKATTGFHVRSKNSIDELKDRLKKRDVAVLHQIELKERVKGLEQLRQQSRIDDIRRLQNDQNEANKTIISCIDVLRDIEVKIKSFENERIQLNKELREIERAGGGTQIKLLIDAQKEAKNLADFIDEARAAVKSTFHSKLQELVSQHYDQVTPDDTKAHVDKHTLLPALYVDGKVRKNISGAQRQLLVLSHIVSLAQLRKWLHEELTKIGIKPGRIDEHCFVLDSVFGATGDQFREKCAEFLVGKARQVIVLVASQQWDEKVRTKLENHVCKVYRLIRCTSNEEIKPDERTMKIKGKDIEVFQRINNSIKSHTVAEEVLL